MGLPRYESFADLAPDLDRQTALSDAYDSVDNIDARTGMLAETEVTSHDCSSSESPKSSAQRTP